MAQEAPTCRMFPNLGRREMSEEGNELTSAAPSQDGESAATLATSASNGAGQEERESPPEEQESTAAAVSSSIPCISVAFDPHDENRGADPALAGDLFDIDPILLQDNPLFGTLARNQGASLFDHEEMLRMASRYTIAKMAQMYQEKHGKVIQNKRISVRLDAAKGKLAKARGCLRKDIVAAFEEEKRKYGVEKAKNMEAGRKRKAQKQAAAAAKAAHKKRKTSIAAKPVPEDDQEDSEVDDFAALEERRPDCSDDEVAEMTQQEKRGQLQVKPSISKKAGKKRKRSPSPKPKTEEDDEESLPDYSDEEMADMARKENAGEPKVKERPAKHSQEQDRQSSSPPMPQHLQRGAVESGAYTEEHAAKALMMLSREARLTEAQPVDEADADGEEDEE